MPDAQSRIIHNDLNLKPTIILYSIFELIILVVGLSLDLLNGPTSTGIPWLSLSISIIVMVVVGLRLFQVIFLKTPKLVEVDDQGLVLRLGFGINKAYKLEQVKAIGFNEGLWPSKDLTKSSILDIRTDNRTMKDYELAHHVGITLKDHLTTKGYDIKIYNFK